MNSDSLTYNLNPKPFEKASVFKTFISSQDEVSGSYTGDGKNIITKDKIFPLGYRQKSFINDSAKCTSIFINHSSSTIAIQPKIRAVKSSDWIFFSFIICLIFAAIFFYKNNKRISQLYKAFLAPHFTNQLIREGNVLREFFIYPLLLIYFTSFMLFISYLLFHFLYYEITVIQGGILFTVIISFFLLKISFVNIIGKIFHTKKETFEYLTIYFIFSVVLGLFLFPFAFFLLYLNPAYSATLAYIILIIMILVTVFRTIRGFFIGLSSERYNLYYLILYLCTVEILPLCISIKLLINFYLTGVFLN